MGIMSRRRQAMERKVIGAIEVPKANPPTEEKPLEPVAPAQESEATPDLAEPSTEPVTQEAKPQGRNRRR